MAHGNRGLGLGDTIGELRALAGRRVVVDMDPGDGSSLNFRGELGDFKRTGEEGVSFAVGEGRVRLRFMEFVRGGSVDDGVVIRFKSGASLLCCLEDAEE